MKCFRCLMFSVFILFVFCNKDAQNEPEVSFYYWKTSFKLSEKEQKVLIENHVKRLYVRYCDVDLEPSSQKPYPRSPIVFERIPEKMTIVPVVYIKNIVMLDAKTDIEGLIKNLLAFIKAINQKNKINSSEIQIDCDWTLKSRDKYLQFIHLLKIRSNKTISVTIRLHQTKYFFKTGIPDADYGVLMFYNINSITSDTVKSIYTENTAKKYLNSLKNYPLDLDVAFPIFSQALQIRDKRVIQLISKLDLNSFAKDTNFEFLNNNFIITQNSNFKNGLYFKQKDEIKLETISYAELMEMAMLVSKSLSKKTKRIIYFDLDSSNLKIFSNENQQIKQIHTCF